MTVMILVKDNVGAPLRHH